MDLMWRRQAAGAHTDEPNTGIPNFVYVEALPTAAAAGSAGRALWVQKLPPQLCQFRLRPETQPCYGSSGRGDSGDTLMPDAQPAVATSTAEYFPSERAPS